MGLSLIVIVTGFIILNLTNDSQDRNTTLVTPEPGDNKIITSASFLKVSTEDLIHDAHAIVIVSVIEIRPPNWRTTPEHESIIYTHVISQDEHNLLGLPVNKQIAVRIDGGRIGDTTVITDYEPVFVLGEQCLLFLVYQPDTSPVPSGIDSTAYYRVAYHMQGKWTFSNGTVVDIECNSYSLTVLQEKINSLHQAK